MDTTDFIKRSNIVHSDRYDYAPTIYTRMHDKVEIVCREHGSFFQKACNHVNGAGCPSCKGGVVIGVEEFLQKATKKFDSKFSYNCDGYLNASSKILVTCPLHGDMTVVATTHIKSEYGCRRCASNAGGKARSMEFNEFLDKAKAVHGEKYSYIPTTIVNNKTKVSMVCEQHGCFSQSINGHLSGSGCRKCGYLTAGGYGSINFTNLGRDASLAGKAAKLYLVKLDGNTEHFYKVGITTQGSAKDRCRNFSHYSCSIIQVIDGTLEDMYELEQLILSSVDRYEPQTYFAGHTECFKSSINLQQVTA